MWNSLPSLVASTKTIEVFMVVAKSCYRNRPNSAASTEIIEWARAESADNDGKLRFSDTGIKCFSM